MSPDPANIGAVADNPQSWNGYSYALNNPETLTDPLGACVSTVMWNPNTGAYVGGSQNQGGSYGVACSAPPPLENSSEEVATELLEWDIQLMSVLSQGPIPPTVYHSGHLTQMPTQPRTDVSCAALRQEAAQLGTTFESMSHSAGLGAAALWFTTAIGATFELPSFGIDSPVTVALGTGAAFFTAAAIDTAAVGSALNSFASGNLTPLKSFAFNQIEDLALKGLASGTPKVGPWAEHLANATQRAQDLANEAPGACK